MKTFLICDKSKLRAHVNEEYDDYIVVDDKITTENIAMWADRIRGRIRKLWAEDGGKEGCLVKVMCDALPPYVAVIMNLKDAMSKEEKIAIEFP